MCNSFGWNFCCYSLLLNLVHIVNSVKEENSTVVILWRTLLTLAHIQTYFKLCMMMDTTKLLRSIPVWMTLIIQDHRVTRKLEIVQSLCYHVAQRNLAFCHGWLCPMVRIWCACLFMCSDSWVCLCCMLVHHETLIQYRKNAISFCFLSLHATSFPMHLEN